MALTSDLHSAAAALLSAGNAEDDSARVQVCTGPAQLRAAIPEAFSALADVFGARPPLDRGGSDERPSRALVMPLADGSIVVVARVRPST